MKFYKLSIVIGAIIGLLLCLVSFGKCSWFEPFKFLQAPWRRECQRAACLDLRCKLQGPVWKGPKELDIQENLAEYRERAGKGDLASQMALVGYYSTSDNARNDEEAMKWGKAAASQGDAHAEQLLGELYRPGGKLSNKEEALKWFRKAAEQGNGESIGQLSIYLEDPEEKYFWDYIFNCTVDAAKLRATTISGIEAIPYCKHVARNTGLTSEQEKDIEKRANDWLKIHDRIETPRLGAALTF